MITKDEWERHSLFERNWWGDCLNTSDEEGKHLEYAKLMGLSEYDIYDAERAFGAKFHLRGKSVLDIGGGPVSLLLKSENWSKAVVVDPIRWPDWIMDRYAAAKIEYLQAMAEEVEINHIFDEVWIYNTLQHVQDPAAIIRKALHHGKLIRVFEWIEAGTEPGHPHNLTAEFLNEHFGAEGTVQDLQWKGYWNPCYVLTLSVEQPAAWCLPKQPDSDITVTITSHGRFDLLKRTVESLWETLEGQPVKVIVSDDSEDVVTRNRIITEYGERFHLYFQRECRGQAANLDFLYDRVDTPYIFHCEDDWEFLAPGYIEKSLALLNDESDIMVVGLERKEEFEKLGAVGARHVSESGVIYHEHPIWRIDETHDWWHGWIGSPHLLRKADWEKLGTFSSVYKEDQYDKLFGESGMRSVWLDERYVKHTGDGRSTFLPGPHIWVQPVGPHWGAPPGTFEGAPGTPGPPGSVVEESIIEIVDSAASLLQTHIEGEHPLYRFHLLGLAHVPTHEDISPCAYTQKVVKLSKMLTELGHTVFLYAGEGSEAVCTELVAPMVTEAARIECYGEYDWKTEFFKHDGNDSAYQLFNQRTIPAVLERYQPGDFLLCSMGTYQSPIANALRQVIPISVVESGIGYKGVFAPYKIFESYAWMNFIHGLLVGQENMKSDGDPSKDITRFEDVAWFDAVIPNYFHPEDFPYQSEKDDHFVYMGRLIRRKGVDIAVQVTEEIGAKLIIAGQGKLVDPVEDLNITQDHVVHIGTVDAEQRKEVLGRARGVFVPTYYLEPFGGIAVEAQMCGTPVITTDYGVFSETVLHGVTGFRCRTFKEFIQAARQIDVINTQDCRDWAVQNYSVDRVKWLYQGYFEALQCMRYGPDDDVARAKGGWYWLDGYRGDVYNRYQRWYPAHASEVILPGMEEGA